jgi:hypothetical protein
LDGHFSHTLTETDHEPYTITYRWAAQ